MANCGRTGWRIAAAWVMVLTGCAVGAEPPGTRTEKRPESPALSVAQVLDRMETARRKLKSFRAKVSKRRHVVPLDDVEEFEGEIRFKMPRLLYMELRSKETGKVTAYIVGRKYGWIYRRSDKQAEGVPLKDLKARGQGGHPLEYGLADEVHKLRKNYALKLLGREKIADADTTVLEMTPKGNAADNEDGKVVLWLDQRTWMIRRVKEIKNDGDIVETHTLHEMETNVDLEDEVFEFKPGKDVDVLIHPAE